MSTLIRRGLGAATAAAALAAPFVLAGGVAQAAEPYQVLLGGLNNPRGVAVAANGSVYVAEAGTGGSDLTIPGPEGTLHVGLTGQIRSVNPATGSSHVVLDGLVSAAEEEDGSFASGVAGLSAQGSTVYAIMDAAAVFVGDAQGPTADVARAQLGRLLTVTPSGQSKTVADVGTFDFDWTGTQDTGIVDGDPDAQDANPYGVLATPGTVLVADAGANTITAVKSNGGLSIAGVVPKNPAGFLADAVPTCVADAGNGHYWIGTLDNQVVPFDGSAVGTPLTLSGDPLFSIGGCVGDGHGGLYASDQASFFFGQPGSVVHISPTGEVTTVVGGLFAPGDVALSKDGASLYVTTNSVLPGAGQLIKVDL